MFYEILPDPRALVARRGDFAVQTLHVHRSIPEQVPVGHFEDRGAGGVDEVVDTVVPRATYLDWIQRACGDLGDRLEVRFYAHHGDDEFDASVLDHLHEIRRLAIDGVPSIRHAEAVGRLPKLTALQFTPSWQLTDPWILHAFGLQRLTHFTLVGITRMPAIDLAPLAEAHALRTLRVLGRGKNTEAIGHCTALTELAIAASNAFPLDFIEGLDRLEVLKFVLGSVKSIRAIGSLPALRDLSFREVRYLEDLGDLERFPLLRRVQIEDQPRIAESDVGPGNAALEHIYLYSVPALRSLEGPSKLPALKSLWAYDSRLDLPWSELPPTLTHFQLVTRAVRGRKAHEAEVKARGMTPELHPDAHFLYK